MSQHHPCLQRPRGAQEILTIPFVLLRAIWYSKVFKLTKHLTPLRHNIIGSVPRAHPHNTLILENSCNPAPINTEDVCRDLGFVDAVQAP